jgi:hypothetical protein
MVFSFDSNKKDEDENSNIIDARINENIKKIINFIEYAVKEENENVQRTFFFDKIFDEMFKYIYQWFRIIVNNDKQKNKEIDPLKPFIKNLEKEKERNKTNKIIDNKHLYFDYDEYKEYNDNIFTAFYTFNLSLYEYLHNQLKIAFFNNNNNKSEYNSVFYELQIKRINDVNLGEIGNIFMELFEKTSKYQQFINLYLTKNICDKYSKPSKIIAEEFINFNKDLKKNELKDSLQIIDKIYQNSNQIAKIDFLPFYYYYREHLSKYFFNTCLESKIIKTFNNYTYSQKEFLLDNDIIKRYVFLLNNMKDELFKIFPTYEYKRNKNEIAEIDANFCADFLDSYFFEEKYYSKEEILLFIILKIYIIALKKNKTVFHFFEEIMKSKIQRKAIFRKYIFIILLILNDEVKEKIKKNENYINELLLYKEVMNCICENQSKDKILYYPNERLSDIIYNFNIYQDKYEDLIKKNEKFREECIKMTARYNSFDKEILEDGVDYKVLLQNNACRDKGPISEETLLKISEAFEYKGHIMTTCKTCQVKIKPDLFFIHVPLNKSTIIGFYSLSFSYSLITDAFKVFMTNNLPGKNRANEILFNVIGNIIYYLNYTKKDNYCNLSDYLALCLI